MSLTKLFSLYSNSSKYFSQVSSKCFSQLSSKFISQISSKCFNQLSSKYLIQFNSSSSNSSSQQYSRNISQCNISSLNRWCNSRSSSHQQLRMELSLSQIKCKDYFSGINNLMRNLKRKKGSLLTRTKDHLFLLVQATLSPKQKSWAKKGKGIVPKSR